MKQLKSRINEAVDVLCHGVPKRSKKVALSQWAFLVQSCGRWLFSELLKLPIRLGLSPQCGFASVWEGNPLTEAVSSCEFYQASCWNVLVTQGRAQEVDFSQWNSEAGLERCVIGCVCVVALEIEEYCWFWDFLYSMPLCPVVLWMHQTCISTPEQLHLFYWPNQTGKCRCRHQPAV